MPEDAAAGLVQHEVSQGFVGCDEARLVPDRVAWRGCHAAHDDIADLALGLAADDLDRLDATHDFASCSPEFTGYGNDPNSGRIL